MANRVPKKTKKNNRLLPTSAPRRRRTHKWPTILFFIALIIVAGFILYNLFQPIKFQDTPPKISMDDNTTSEAINPENVKGETKDSSGKDENNEAPEIKNTASDGTPLRNEGSDPNSSDTLTGAITFSGLSEGNFLIRVNIDQYLSSGTCDLTLASKTTEGVSYTMQVPIIPSVSSSTCDGFTYEASEIRPGNYTIKVDLRSGSKTGTLTGEVSL